MPSEEKIASPNLPWRLASATTIATVGALSKAFFAVATTTDIHGLDNFVKVLDARRDVQERERGLLTVSNHLCVVDDPLIWGVLPFRFLFSLENMRWSLGSHDICFKNKAVSTFFSLGQVLPAHRQLYSQHGGLFQPTIAQSIRLLSRGPYTTPTPPHPSWPSEIYSPASLDVTDPFTNPTHIYSTTGTDSYQAPSSYPNRRHSWIHIFPEGKVHQRTDRNMRYFKWGVARLILESEPCPEVVPMWIEGFDEIMHEERPTPRWWPRWGKKISVTFGKPVSESVWRGFRERWTKLREKEMPDVNKDDIGVLNEQLMNGQEAALLRMEVTMKVREQVLRLRRERGWPDEDPKSGLVETYLEEGGKGEGKMEDGSWVKDT